jgi:hypothetical protein
MAMKAAAKNIKNCFIISTIFAVPFLSRIGKSQHIFSAFL